MVRMGVVLSAVATAANLCGRPLEMANDIRSCNRYEGMWEERCNDMTLRISFTTNNWGVFEYRGRMLPFVWSADSAGKIKCFDKPDGGRQVLDLTYIPDEDLIDCGFGTNRSELGFTGRCAFKSYDLSDDVIKALKSAEQPAPMTREGRFEELKKSADSRLQKVTNLSELINPSRLLERRECLETVDLEYPRIITDEGPLMPMVFPIYVFYGAYEPNPIKGHALQDPIAWRRSMKRERASKANDIGVSQKEADAALAELTAAGIKAYLFYNEYGEGKVYWREDGLCCIINESQHEKAVDILSRHFLDKRPRCVFVKQVEKFYDAR